MVDNPRWLDVIELMVYKGVTTAKEISKELDVSQATINYWRTRPEFQALLEEELNTKLAMIRNEFKLDIDTVYKEMYSLATESEEDNIRFRASQFILEQVLGKAGQQYYMTTKKEITYKTPEEDILDIFEEVEKDD